MVNILKSSARAFVIGSLLLPFGLGEAFAGGFEVQQSAYFQGMSFAGIAAGGPSLASISWNPAASAFAGAGLTTESSAAVVLPEVDVTVLNPEAQLPPPGTAKVDMGQDVFIAADYGTYRLNDKTVIGLSITSPFGLVSKPDDVNWIGKYVAETTKIFSLNATPSISYEIAPGLSVGGGVQVQLFDIMELRALTPLGGSNISGDDVGVGFVAGINFRPAPGTSLGFGFRSSVHQQVEGDEQIRFNSQAALLGLSGVGSSPVKAGIDLPAKATFSFRQALSPRARLLGTVDWTNWGELDVIPVVLERPFSLGPFIPPINRGATIANLNFGWRDGWLFAVGGEYDWSRDLTMRAGIAYEVSPIQDATTRLVQVPDTNHTWASVGASYKLGPRSSIDFAYSHGFFEDDAPFKRFPASTLLQGVSPLLGQVDTSVDIVSIGWKMQWGGSRLAESLK